jgi:mannose-1-phosphate guanylyltransferase
MERPGIVGSLWQVGEKDDLNNVVKGDVVLHDVGESYLHAETA